MVEDKKRKLEEDEDEEKEAVEEVEMAGKSRLFQPYSNLLYHPDTLIRIPPVITFSFIDLLSFDSLSEVDDQEDSVEGGEKGRDDRVENPKKRHASESAMSAVSGEMAFFFNLEIIHHLIEPCHTLYDAVVHSDMPARMSNQIKSNQIIMFTEYNSYNI